MNIFDDLLRATGDIVLPVDTKPCDDEAMKTRIDNGAIIEITKQMQNESAVGEFIGIAKITKSVIGDLNQSSVYLLRSKQFTSYFEGITEND